MTSFCGQHEAVLAVFVQFEQVWPFDPFHFVFTHKKYILGVSIIRVGNAEKSFCHISPPMSLYDVILWSKRHLSDYFWSIWTDIWPFDPFYFVFTHKKYILGVSIVRVDNVENFFCHISPQFWRMTSFYGQSDVFLTIFGQFRPIYGVLTLLTLFLPTIIIDEVTQ